MLLEGIYHQWTLYCPEGLIVLLDYDIVALVELLEEAHIGSLQFLEVVLGEFGG